MGWRNDLQRKRHEIEQKPDPLDAWQRLAGAATNDLLRVLDRAAGVCPEVDGLRRDLGRFLVFLGKVR